MKPILLYLLFFLVFISCQRGFSANNPNNPKKSLELNQTKSDKSSDKMFIQNLKKGKSFKSGQDQYLFLPELYAISETSVSKSHRSANLSKIQKEKTAERITQKGPYAIYQSGSGNELQSLAPQNLRNEKLLPIVLNSRTNNLGIITGQIKIGLKDMSDAEYLAKDLNLKFIKKYAHLGIAFYEIEPNQDIVDKLNELQSDMRVKRASLEIMEHMIVPH